MASRKWIPSQIRAGKASFSMADRLGVGAIGVGGRRVDLQRHVVAQHRAYGCGEGRDDDRVTAQIIRVRRSSRFQQRHPRGVRLRCVVSISIGGWDGLERAPEANVVLKSPRLMSESAVAASSAANSRAVRTSDSGWLSSRSSKACRSCKTIFALKNFAVSVWAAVRSVEAWEPRCNTSLKSVAYAALPIGSGPSTATS